MTISSVMNFSKIAMQNCGVWVANETMRINQTLKNGDYEIYLFIMENYKDYNRSFDLEIESEFQDSNIGSLSKDEWLRYESYSIIVKNSELNINLSYRLISLNLKI